MGACCAQIKGFTLGCREVVLVKAFYLNPIGFAPISGLWRKVFVKALPNNQTSSAVRIRSFELAE